MRCAAAATASRRRARARRSAAPPRAGAAPPRRARRRRSGPPAGRPAPRVPRGPRRARAPGCAGGARRGGSPKPADLPIARYDALNVQEINEQLPTLSQTDLAKVEAYERRHENRSTVTERISALRSSEPWPGYDDQTADEVASVLRSADDDDARKRAARDYERAHKNRSTVLELV